MQKLQVPENISLRWELMHGFGKPELAKTLLIAVVVLAIGAGCCVLHGGKNDSITLTVVLIFCLVICAGFFTKLEMNQSIYDFLRRSARYKKQQQQFLFYKEKGGITFVPETEERPEKNNSAGVCER